MRTVIPIVFSLFLAVSMYGQQWQSLNTANGKLPSNVIMGIYFDRPGLCTERTIPIF